MPPNDVQTVQKAKLEGYCTIFMRQMSVLLLKNLIVLIRHPVFLALMLIYPALLVILISGRSITERTLVERYPTVPLHDFTISEKKIGYYPSDDVRVQRLMQFILESHNPPLTDDALIGFATEQEIAEYTVENPDALAVAFTFTVNSLEPASLSIDYYWRVNRYYLTSNPDPTISSYFDPFRAERLAQMAIIRYILNTTFTSKLKAIAEENALVSDVEPARQLVHAYDLIKRNRVRIDNDVTYTWFPDFEWYALDDFYNPILERGGLVLGISTLFLVYYFCYQMVYEKESKLRQSLHTIGMLDSTYFLSHALIGFMLCMAIGLCSTIVGLITSSEYWLNTPFLANWCTITMFNFSVLSVAVFISSFISKAQTTAFLVFVLTLFLFFLGVVHSTPKTVFPEKGSFSIFYFLPFSHSFQALILMSLKAYTFPYKYILHSPSTFMASDLINFTGICDPFECGQQTAIYDSGHCVLFYMLIPLVICICYWILAAYVDLLLPSAHGSSLKFWAPFTLEFWGCLKTANPPDSHKPNYKKPPARVEWDEDVVKEQNMVLAPLGTPEYIKVADSPVLIYDLNVTYGGCCKRDNVCATAMGCGMKHAVKNLSLSIPRNTIYGLLGPNGAGKSTTLSVLTGTLKPTSGYVAIEGYSITHQRQKVCQLIGYAPQFDILWPDLTPAEHIKFFCSMRGVDYAKDLEDVNKRRKMANAEGVLFVRNISNRYLNDAPKPKKCCARKQKVDKKDEVFKVSSIKDIMSDKSNKSKNTKAQAFSDLLSVRLQTVGLDESAHFQSRSLSGGMKRRLSIALSLIGDVRVIFLDEASTGLDPISKRKMWDAIQMAKYNRSIVLTTHSMEECEALATCVGIIADGCLRCNNTMRRLKKKYGIGYRLDIEVTPDDVLRVRDELINVYCPNAVLVSRTSGNITLAIPKRGIGEAFETMLSKISTAEWILNWSIRQTTMEEIFLTVVNIDHTLR